jgi:hypothetical protein
MAKSSVMKDPRLELSNGAIVNTLEERFAGILGESVFHEPVPTPPQAVPQLEAPPPEQKVKKGGGKLKAKASNKAMEEAPAPEPPPAPVQHHPPDEFDTRIEAILRKVLIDLRRS